MDETLLVVIKVGGIALAIIPLVYLAQRSRYYKARYEKTAFELAELKEGKSSRIKVASDEQVEKYGGKKTFLDGVSGSSLSVIAYIIAVGITSFAVIHEGQVQEVQRLKAGIEQRDATIERMRRQLDGSKQGDSGTGAGDPGQPAGGDAGPDVGTDSGTPKKSTRTGDRATDGGADAGTPAGGDAGTRDVGGSAGQPRSSGSGAGGAAAGDRGSSGGEGDSKKSTR